MAKPILLYSSIYPEATREFTEQLMEIPEGDIVDIWIDSPGGSVSSGWAIIAALSSRANVNMRITGDASSMAFFMLLFADHTTAFDSSNFLLHRASAGWWEAEMSDEEREDLEGRNKLLRRKLESRVDESIFTSVTGKTFDDIFSMEQRLDVYLTAKQAKKVGLIDEVITINTSKRKEIEANYIKSIAALAINNNKIKKNMGLFSKEKPIFLAEIGGKQCAYSTLEEGKEIKAIGSDNEVISGTFESGDKKVTVVGNKITAVSSIDPQAKRIEALEAKITSLAEALEAKVKTAEPETKVDDSKVTALENKVGELTAILEKAKLTASKPKLPQAEFKQESKEVELSAKQRLKAKRKETK